MEVRLAKVINVNDAGRAAVMFYGDTSPSEKNYPYLRNVVPEKDDTVALIKQGDTYIIIGIVVTDTKELQFAMAEHTHDGVYAKEKHTHTGLTNGEYGVELSSGGVLLPLKSLAASLGSETKAFAEMYGDKIYVLTSLDIGDRQITKDSVGTSAKKFTSGYFTKVFVGGTELNETKIEELEATLKSNRRKIVFNGTMILPDVTNAVSLGSSAYQFLEGYYQNLYLKGSAVSTSDKKKKKCIKNIPEKFAEFFMKLRPVTFKYKNGTSGRSHVGFIAQEVEQAMNDTGITAEEFGGLVIQKNGEYGLRYEEFIGIQTKIIQQLCKRVEVLERKVMDREGN